ncbi:MarR family transcriptional regulator [Kitasatospora sp. NBC_01287]|uniref:MarR family winged helix-turn-helix transcriptional regulator n=1 Tax=Kitasatospora sp. NBC_01287 TaxID=2903573 RepID=UPI0022508A7D|nr:MarR family transcriptional regulator [Kitasatospora sp. NBC_01287]MCX4745634.1 MarR family transcriptional regulator [Kitasatospora sp. NBC_01287]
MPESERGGGVVALDRLARQAGRLAQLVNATTHAAAAEAGLTNADADVLLALHQAHEQRLRPTTLAAACGLSSGGTSNIINRLAHAGYVNREANAQDGRSSWVQLTEEGRGLAALVTEAAAAEHIRLLTRLPEGIAEALAALLDTAVGHLDPAAVRAGGEGRTLGEGRALSGGRPRRG